MANKNVKDTVFLVLALAVMVGSRLMPGMWGLSKEAMGVLGVFFGSLIMWITISIDWPSMITLLALGFLPTFGFCRLPSMRCMQRVTAHRPDRSDPSPQTIQGTRGLTAAVSYTCRP